MVWMFKLVLFTFATDYKTLSLYFQILNKLGFKTAIQQLLPACLQEIKGSYTVVTSFLREKLIRGKFVDGKGEQPGGTMEFKRILLDPIETMALTIN